MDDYVIDIVNEFLSVYEKATGRTFTFDDEFATVCFCFFAVACGLGFAEYVSTHSAEISKIICEVLNGNK